MDSWVIDSSRRGPSLRSPFIFRGAVAPGGRFEPISTRNSTDLGERGPLEPLGRQSCGREAADPLTTLGIDCLDVLLGEQVGAVAAGGRRRRGHQLVADQRAQKRSERGGGLARPLGDVLDLQRLPGIEDRQDRPPGPSGRHAQPEVGEYVGAVVHADQKPLRDELAEEVAHVVGVETEIPPHVYDPHLPVPARQRQNGVRRGAPRSAGKGVEPRPHIGVEKAEAGQLDRHAVNRRRLVVRCGQTLLAHGADHSRNTRAGGLGHHASAIGAGNAAQKVREDLVAGDGNSLVKIGNGSAPVEAAGIPDLDPVLIDVHSNRLSLSVRGASPHS